MNVLLTGGTGMLGRALCAPLIAEGHQLTVLSRRPHQVHSLCGRSVNAMTSLSEWTPDKHFDLVINLAGAPIIDLPWTSSRKKTLWSSRIELTEQLVAALSRADRKPHALLSASAIGYYGNCGDTTCSDAFALPCPSADDFGARLCAAWEAAALTAQASGVRVCLLRTGLVLARDAGLLARMRQPFKLGLGGRLGNGQQWMSWIHLHDWLSSVRFLINNDQASGAFNLTAPNPVRNAEFTESLAQSFGRSSFLPMPSLVLNLLLGERAYLVLGGQRVLPDRLQAMGLGFSHPLIKDALRNLA